MTVAKKGGRPTRYEAAVKADFKGKLESWVNDKWDLPEDKGGFSEKQKMEVFKVCGPRLIKDTSEVDMKAHITEEVQEAAAIQARKILGLVQG